jgi:hypothetical protein
MVRVESEVQEGTSMKALFVMLALTPLVVACQQSSSPSAAEGKVADTRHDVATKEVAALQQQAKTDAAANTDASEALRKAEAKKADSAYDVAITEAQGRYKISRAQCDALSGNAKHTCVEHADAALALSKADAEDARKATAD